LGALKGGADKPGEKKEPLALWGIGRNDCFSVGWQSCAADMVRERGWLQSAIDNRLLVLPARLQRQYAADEKRSASIGNGVGREPGLLEEGRPVFTLVVGVLGVTSLYT